MQSGDAPVASTASRIDPVVAAASRRAQVAAGDDEEKVLEWDPSQCDEEDA
jgi:hypothetical protein